MAKKRRQPQQQPQESETSKKYARLKTLSDKAKENIFAMLTLTADIIRDREFVDQFGGELQFIEHLESKEFSHFGGTPRLQSMLTAIRAYPCEESWAEYGYNVQAMIDLANPTDKKDRSGYTNWKAKYHDLLIRVKELEAELKVFREIHGSKDKAA